MIITTKHGRKQSIHTEEDQDAVLEQAINNLTPTELALVQAIMAEGEREISEHLQLYSEVRYHTMPVSMEQFIEDPYYLGDSCETLWPELRQDLIDVFESPYREVILTGGIGVGKTFVASIIICRILYELSCLVDPQKTFGLSSGSEIVIPLISKNLILAREVMKSAVDDKVKESPYFLNHFTPNIKREYTLFPNNIRVTIGSYGSERVLGSNVLCAFCDETNFPPKTKKQQITTGFGQKLTAAHFDIVEKVYGNLVRRVKSRFQKSGGDFPGMTILASSAATVDSFTERKIRESKGKSDIFVRDHTPWTARPAETFTGDWFYILCSTSSLKARFIEPEEYEKITDEFLLENDAWIIEVPEEYRQDFETNMEDALRDIAGISTQAISAFLQRIDAIEDCTDGREHPFSEYEWVAGGPGAFEWNKICREFERKLPGGHKETAWAPRIKPNAYRWCHIDTSISGDSSGICVGHVDRWVEVVRRDGDNNRYVEAAPSYVIDFLMRINPPPAEQIYMPDLRRLVYELMEHGFIFAGFSTDSYQYIEMHQQIRRRGISPYLISMDTTTDAYNELKSAIYENRIRFYNYQPFVEELKALEYDRIRGKVDHPQAGCFVENTRIPLLNGSCPTIAEMNGREEWVYSCTPNGRIVPGKARGKLTKYVMELVDVVLDSGAVERCTPDHLWMLRDGTYKAARDLIPGVDRLMPINRVWPVNGGYERVTDLHGDRHLTHHLVWEHLNRGLGQQECVHHKNGTKTDNHPKNLICEELAEHARRHTLKRHAEGGEYSYKVAEGLQAFNLSERGRQVHSEAMRKTNASRSKEDRDTSAKKNPGFRSDITLASLDKARGEENANSAARLLGCGRNVVMRVLRENGFDSWDDFLVSECGNNHKVRYVIPVKLKEPVPVYDLEVDEFSNFALSSGVFVHNSKDVADAMAGVVYGLLNHAERLPLDALAGTKNRITHEYSWVSESIPADKVDLQEVRAAKEAGDDTEILPILFGDE